MKPHESPRIGKKSIRGDSGDSWPVWNRGRSKQCEPLSDLGAYCLQYSKTCLKQPLKKKTKNWFSRPIIA